MMLYILIKKKEVYLSMTHK